MKIEDIKYDSTRNERGYVVCVTKCKYNMIIEKDNNNEVITVGSLGCKYCKHHVARIKEDRFVMCSYKYDKGVK